MNFYTNVESSGDFLYVRGISDKTQFKKRVRYKPTIYTRPSTGTKEGQFHNLQGKIVEPIQFDSIKECRKFVEDYKQVENYDIYGHTQNFYLSYLGETYPNDLDPDLSQIRTAIFDIEVASENGFSETDEASEEITAITIKELGVTPSIAVTFGCGEYDYMDRSDVVYNQCENEHELLERFIETWQAINPDVVTGWNVELYDVPYLVNRMKNIKIDPTRLSPWGKLFDKTFKDRGREYNGYRIAGVSILDYLPLYRKFTYTSQESFKLDHIAYVELGERKLDYTEHETLHQLYKKDYQKFIDYNIKDVDLIEQMEDKLKLIELCLTMAYDAKINYTDVFSQVKMWDALIYNHLWKKKIVIPPKKSSKKPDQYAGGYVKEPQVGIHNWVVSFDLNSLYPHLIMQYNISPETIIDRKNVDPELCELTVNVDSLLNQELDLSLLKRDQWPSEPLTVTPNGQFFSTKKQGFLPELMQKMYNDRVTYKKKLMESRQALETEQNSDEKMRLKREVATYHNIQMAKKIALNSAYGALGNEYFRYFDIRQAEAVTLSGQLAIRWIEQAMNEWLTKLLQHRADYVIASDTDSIYLDLEPLVEKSFKTPPTYEKAISFLDKVCQTKFEPFIDNSYKQLAEYVNAFAQKMTMKREVIADKGIWTSKKRYILNVYDSEGLRYLEPQIKVMGIEAVKSSTPEICRSKIREALKLIMTKDEESVIKFIETFRQEFFQLPAEDISFPRSCNNLNRYVNQEKSIPIHVKGALVFNRLLKEKKLKKRYQVIRQSDKIKFVYLKTPNTAQSHVIALLSTLPREFKLDKYLDYETQFAKAFVDPLNLILQVIGWKTEQVGSLEGFFQ